VYRKNTDDAQENAFNLQENTFNTRKIHNCVEEKHTVNRKNTKYAGTDICAQEQLMHFSGKLNALVKKKIFNLPEKCIWSIAKYIEIIQCVG
jgi:hypothetical protein